MQEQFKRTEIEEASKRLIVRHCTLGKNEQGEKLLLLCFEEKERAIGRFYLVPQSSRSFWRILINKWPNLRIRLSSNSTDNDVAIPAQEIPAATEGLASRFSRTFKSARIYPLEGEIIDQLSGKEASFYLAKTEWQAAIPREFISTLMGSADV